MADKAELYRQAEKRVGTLLKGKYQIDRLLGIGGMAAVYAATHRNRRRFAVKMLHPELCVRDDVCKRFIREGYIANMVDHPGVVTVLDDDINEDGLAYLVMELLDGVGVEKLCKNIGESIPPREVLGIAHQLLEVLTAAHEKSVVHRDIKPANLLVTQEGQVKVLDFGIARLKETTNETHLTRTGVRMGTPAFMSPEQAMAESREIDACTDIWSVGATLFRMLSGQYVHPGENASKMAIRTATKPARSLAEVAPDLPDSVVKIVDKALAFEKKHRFESADAMRQVVETVHTELYGELSHACLASYVSSRLVDTSPLPSDSAEEEISSHTQPVTPEVPLSDSDTSQRVSNRAVKPPRKRRAIALTAGMTALLAIGAWLWIYFISPGSVPGVLSIRATTDMLVPTDVDWISWTLTVQKSAHSTKQKQGDLPMTDWKDLPLVLTKISTTDTTKPSKLEMIARRGGKHGEIVLRRAETVAAPRKGENQVTLSLDWLCSNGMLDSPCENGSICEAGTCVPQTTPHPPQPLRNVVSGPKCFDTERCFASGVVVTVPPRDPITRDQCILNQSHALMNVEKKNIALVVNTSTVGNFGVCGPAGQCLIPMDKNSPNGWEIQRENGEVTGIRLPKAVCRDIGQGKLRGVAMVPAMSGCPPKSAHMPLCSAPDACVPTEGICPEDLPAAWEGFTCSGAASPQMLRKDLIGCFIPPQKSERPMPSGQWCCSKGEPPGTNPLLVDDMSGGPQLKLIPPKTYRGGMWWTASDAKGMEIVPPPNPGMFTLTSITPPVAINEEKSFNRAACVRSPGFTGWIALMGFNFISAKDDAMAPSFDVTPFSGIRFWAHSPRGDQYIKVGFADQNTYTEDARSTCNKNPKAGRCGDDWAIQKLLITNQWKEYVVKWDDLSQSSIEWGGAKFDAFDRKRVFTTYFGVGGKGPTKQSPPFEFCVSQIYFTK